MKELRAVLIDSIQAIDQTTELFYQQKREEGYKQLDKTLSTLTHTLNCLFNYKSEGNDIGIEENQLNSVLIEAMKAIEAKDTILLSDILQYDLKEVLEKVLSNF